MTTDDMGQHSHLPASGLPHPPAALAPDALPQPLHLRTGSGLLGIWLTAGSGVVALLAFVALPVVTVPIVGSYTVVNLADLLGEVGLGGAAHFAWIVPIAALALIAAGLAGLERHTGGGAGGGGCRAGAGDRGALAFT